MLRIGIIEGEDIGEARILPRRKTVTVGPSRKNDFKLRSRKLPHDRYPLFELDEEGYVLNFGPEFTGRIGMEGKVHTLETMLESGSAEKGEYGFRLRLDDTARGKVVIGGTALLFEFAPRPKPPASPPHLPSTVKGGVLGDVDWRFTSFVLSSFLLFFGAFLILDHHDPVIEQGALVVPEQYARLVIDAPPPPPDVPDVEEMEESEEAEEVEETEAEAQPRERAPAREAPQRAPATQERRARLANEIASQAQSVLLGALGQGESELADLLSQGLVMRSAADVMAEASGVGATGVGAAGQILAREGGGEGSGSGELGSLGTLGEAQGAGQELGTKRVERRVTGRVGLAGGGATGGTGDFDPSIVRNMIRRRIRAIRACYERALRQDPNLGGKVTVRFTIQPSGTVSNAVAAENTTGNAGVASCVVSTVRRFRFNPGPTGGSVTFSYPFVFAPQG